MNKLDIVKFLIEEIKKEQELIEIVKADQIQADAKAIKTDGYWWSFREYTGRQPSESRIKANCKKIRQLISDISKEEY